MLGSTNNLVKMPQTVKGGKNKNGVSLLQRQATSGVLTNNVGNIIQTASNKYYSSLKPKQAKPVNSNLVTKTLVGAKRVD